MTKQKQIIAVDIDDVLSASAAGFARYSNKRWGASLTADDYDEDWSKFWGVSMKEALHRVEAVYGSDLFGSYAALDGALPVLHELKKRYHLVVVTSRRRSLQAETEVWLDRNFPQIFSAVHYAGLYDEDESTQSVREALKRNKAELCGQIGANYLIDDQLKHCLAAAERGVQVLLFGNYRWNRTNQKLSDRITEVHSWQAVKEYFDVQS